MSNSPIANTKTCEPFRAWNRLEQRPRTREFDRVLKAEIHDPLWTLTRQWQFGEFKGEDTGSAILAKVKLQTSRVARFQNQDNSSVPFNDQDLPMEARVERMPVQYDLRFRARSGQQFVKLLQAAGNQYNVDNGLSSGDPGFYDHALIKAGFIALFPFELPVIDRNTDSTALQLAKARVLSDQKTHQSLSVLVGRAMDGVQWAEVLVGLGAPVAAMPPSITGMAGYDPAHLPVFLSTANLFLNWFEKSHTLPEASTDSSWSASNLEYKFACSLPAPDGGNNAVLEAEEYYQGRLDWYAFSLALNDNGKNLIGNDPGESNLIDTKILTMIPTESRFAGMPNSRWWEFEDGRVDLGNISADTTDVAKILLAEFALMYSNDWFVIPYPTEAGTLSEVKGIIVTDTFGQKTLVEAADQGRANDWNGWTMFNQSRTNAGEGLPDNFNPMVFIPPALSKVQESKPLESVLFLRDEMANMVWAIEHTIPDLHGGGRDGSKAAVEMTNLLNQLDSDLPEPVVDIPFGVRLNYKMANEVPENWIPFLPTHIPGQNRAIQLQRASMPRWFNSNYSQVRPRTGLLRTGMEENSATLEGPFVNPSDENQTNPFYVYEEELPRAGVKLDATWQRARWYGGKTVCWYGIRKQTGRGEGASGLAFDQVLHVPVDEL